VPRLQRESPWGSPAVAKLETRRLFDVVDRRPLGEEGRYLRPYEIRNGPRGRLNLNDEDSPLRRYYTAGTFVNLEFKQRLYIREIFPECRVANVSIDIHRRNKEALHRLKASDWPSKEGRALWPSSPTFLERLEMLRRGVSPCNERTPGMVYRESIHNFNKSVELCKRVIGRAVLGLRSDVEIPDKYLGYFRYCRNFAILTAPYALNIGLARFLASLWVNDPFSLWLERRVSLRQYLRELPLSFKEWREEEICPLNDSESSDESE